MCIRLLLLTVFTSLIPSLQGEERFASRLDVLTRNYDSAVERATKPIRIRYIEELKKLKNDHTRSGKLNEALEVEKRLKELGVIEETLSMILQERSWNYRAYKGPSPIKFNSDGTVDRSGKISEWTWELKNAKTLRLNYEDKNYCDFEFRDFKVTKVVGNRRDGGQRTLELVSK